MEIRRYMSETHYQHPTSRRSHYGKDMDDSEILHADFRRPRDTLLSVVAEFYTKGTVRCQELQLKSPDQKPVELLDVKCHFVSIPLLKFYSLQCLLFLMFQ